MTKEKRKEWVAQKEQKSYLLIEKGLFVWSDNNMYNFKDIVMVQ